jgi:hypothetical protein
MKTLHCHSWSLAIRFLVAALLVVTAASAPGQAPSDKATSTAAPHKEQAAAVEVRYIDDSTMKLTVLDEQVELVTPYGKLLIPLSAIVKIEFATRLPEDIAKKIAAAVAELGHADFKKRSAASAELTRLGERAYPALVDAAKQADPEVVKRAEEVLHKIRQAVPADHLEVRPSDVVTTADSRISGRIVATALKVKTFQFGDQQLKLTDMRSMQPVGADKGDSLADALPDPGTLAGFAGQVGRTYVFRVTGAGAGAAGQPGQLQIGGVWGTGVYTTDSALALAAVHAGILRAGQTGPVRVTLMGNVPAFMGSFQNGINSGNYPGYAGYKVSK